MHKFIEDKDQILDVLTKKGEIVERPLQNF
jgi:hypothetical protein